MRFGVCSTAVVPTSHDRENRPSHGYLWIRRGDPYSLHYVRVTGREVETPAARSIHRKTRLVPCTAAISTTCERNRSN